MYMYAGKYLAMIQKAVPMIKMRLAVHLVELLVVQKAAPMIRIQGAAVFQVVVQLKAILVIHCKVRTLLLMVQSQSMEFLQ